MFVQGIKTSGKLFVDVYPLAHFSTAYYMDVTETSMYAPVCMGTYMSDFSTFSVRYTLAAISDAQKKLEESDVEHLNLLDQVLLTPGLSRADVLVFMMDFLLGGIDNVRFFSFYTIEYFLV